MEYIDKQKGKADAHRLLGDFLHRYGEGGAPFPDDLYGALKADRKGVNNTFLQYSEKILQENECRCCYCMRTLVRNERSGRFHLTLEHVVPNSIESEDEYHKYFEISSDLETESMVLTSKFMESPKWPPFPHRIAYENLIPSCLGLFPKTPETSNTCNVKRGNTFVYPFVFRKNINDEIKYYNDGTIEWTKDPGDGASGQPYVNLLGLNYLDLRFIRCAWYFMTKEGLEYIPANIDRLFKVIAAELDDSEQNSKELLECLLSFKRDDYWQLLGEFQYFNNSDLFSQR